MASPRTPMISLVIFALICLTFKAVSQQVIVNSNGERIVMYPDGSWRKVEPGDSVLLRQSLQAPDLNSGAGTGIGQPTERNQGEEHEYLHRRWKALYADITTKEKAIQNEFRNATNAQFKASELWHNAEANKALMEADRLAQLKEDFDQSVHQLSVAKVNQKEMKKLLEKAKKIDANKSKLTETKLNRMQSNYNLFLAKTGAVIKIQNVPPSPYAAPSPKNNKQQEHINENPPSLQGKEKNSTYPAMTGVSPPHRNPKPYVAKPVLCSFSTNSVDEASGRKRKELLPEIIFTHTDPDLRPYFKDKDLITCIGRLYKLGPYIYLNLDFQIASSHSQSNFGALATGSLLRFKLLNGDFVSLYNLRSDRGHIDPYSGNTVFSSQYAIGKEEIKKFTKTELDKMRVLWSTGYEDYDISNIDFLKNQLHCLLSGK